LNSGDGTPALKWGSTGVYREDAEGKPGYDWTLLDRIFDTYHACGVKPYVEIGFMPKEFSTHPEPYQHNFSPTNRNSGLFTGWAYPPKDYAKWEELVYQWTLHDLRRYGSNELASWYWEVWNEANIGYWRGTPADFQKLHDYAIAGVRRAFPAARVGGPDAAGSGGVFTRAFLEHCLRGTNYATGGIGTPLDFVSFHAKGGNPMVTNGVVRMGIANQLRTIADGFNIVASYPELKDKPIVIGESDPEGCAACLSPPYVAYRNGTVYSSYTAASFGHEQDLADRAGVNLRAALTWAFEFEDQPYFAGFRALATEGIDLPVLNVFRMFSRMSGERVRADSDGSVPLDTLLRSGVRGRPDVSALASLDGKRLCVLVWHYHDDDVTGPDAAVTLSFGGMPAGARQMKLVEYRVDAEHSNAFAVWQKMGRPQPPSARQAAQLEKAGQLETTGKARTVKIESGNAEVQVNLPRQAVELLEFDLE
jgi:xylan 1,4-beta-xylosidase